MVATTKRIDMELRQIRTSLAVLEAAYFQLADVFEARGAPYLLTIPKAAKLLGVGEQALRWLIDDKKIRKMKVGKRVMVARNELERFSQRAVGFELAPGLERKLQRRPLSIAELTSQESRALTNRKRRAIAAVNAPAPVAAGR